MNGTSNSNVSTNGWQRPARGRVCAAGSSVTHVDQLVNRLVHTTTRTHACARAHTHTQTHTIHCVRALCNTASVQHLRRPKHRKSLLTASEPCSSQGLAEGALEALDWIMLDYDLGRSIQYLQQCLVPFTSRPVGGGSMLQSPSLSTEGLACLVPPTLYPPDPWLEACAQTRVKRAQACAVLGGKCA